MVFITLGLSYGAFHTCQHFSKDCFVFIFVVFNIKQCLTLSGCEVVLAVEGGKDTSLLHSRGGSPGQRHSFGATRSLSGASSVLSSPHWRLDVPRDPGHPPLRTTCSEESQICHFEFHGVDSSIFKTTTTGVPVSLRTTGWLPSQPSCSSGP